MGSFAEKLSPYDFINNLFPGVLVSAFVAWSLDLSFIAEGVVSIVVYFCIVYFVGIIMSRLGSLVLEPIFRKVRIAKWHKNYYVGERDDPKIPTLLRDLNMYRSLVASSLFCCLISLAAVFITKTISCYTCLETMATLFIIAVVFVCSYSKQSRSIYRRVDAIVKYSKGEQK